MANTPRNREQWKNVIEKQRASGLDPREFCNQEQVNIHRFYYYRSVLFPKQIKRLKKSSFVQVKTSAIPRHSVTLEAGFVKINVDQSQLDFIVAICQRLNNS